MQRGAKSAPRSAEKTVSERAKLRINYSSVE